METEAIEASVEVGMERVMSGFFPSENGKEETEEEKKQRLHAEYQRRVKRDAEIWAGKGLGLTKDGRVPQGSEAMKHALQELLHGAVRGGALGLALKGTLNVVFALLGRKKNLVDVLKESVGEDSRQFGLFLGAFTGLFRFANALMTSYTGVDAPKNAFVAGGIASIALLLDEKSRRQGIALYLFSRSLDVLTKRLCRDGVIPYWKHFESLLFGISNMPIMYGFLFEPEILQAGYYKWILSMGNVTDEGLKGTLRERRAALAMGDVIPFRSCSYGYHEGPCTVHCVGDWFFGLGRAAKIYLPVHFIPLLLFRYKTLLKDPKTTLLKTMISYASSCAFLTTYVFCVKGSQCFLRNLRQTDADWHALISGLLTGLSCFFEKPSRVSELMLYCVPRGLEATWIYFEKRGMVHNIKNFEAVIFAVAMSILISGARADFKTTYHRSLCFVLGSKVESKKKNSKEGREEGKVPKQD